MMYRMSKMFMIAAAMAAASVQAVQAGSKIYVGARVASNRLVSMDRVDHSVWDGLLHKYVDQNGMVNYHAWKANSADLRALDTYLRSLSTAGPRIQASHEAQLAFWINAYNAVTARGILREYPTSSIRNHTAKLFGYNIWKDLQLYVGGRPYALEQIENQVLRKMGDPRIHFGIVCASIGCPRLLNEAYVANKVQEQLERNAKDFFSRPKNFRYDASRHRFYLSSILSWYGGDFGGNQAAQLRTISRWLPDAASQQAAARNGVQLSFLNYNWGLNDQRTVRSARR